MLKRIVGVALAVILTITILLPVCSSMTSGDDTMDVVVIAGQSNAAYMETTTVGGVTNTICDPAEVNGVVPLPSSDAYYYGTSSVPILFGSYYQNPSYDSSFADYDIHSMTSGDSWLIGGEEASIASAITEKSKSNLLIVNVGIPGAPIDFLLPTSTGGLYVKSVLADAINKIDSKYAVNKLGFVWIQGESNKTTSVDDYMDYFATIFDWYSDKGFGTCYMVQTKPANSGNAAVAQLQICEDDPDVILASTAPSTFTTENGYLVSDNLHYSQLGRNIVGADVGDAVLVNPRIDKGTSDIFMIIPMLVVVAIVAGFALSIYRRNND